jgi:lactate permease
MSSLTCIVVMVIVLKVWTSKTVMRLEGDKPITVAASKHSAGEVFLAWLPYLMLVLFVLAWGEPSVKAAIDRWTHGVTSAVMPLSATGLNGIEVPGLHNACWRCWRRRWCCACRHGPSSTCMSARSSSWRFRW